MLALLLSSLNCSADMRLWTRLLVGKQQATAYLLSAVADANGLWNTHQLGVLWSAHMLATSVQQLGRKGAVVSLSDASAWEIRCNWRIRYCV
jgi:hypothetical protein